MIEQSVEGGGVSVSPVSVETIWLPNSNSNCKAYSHNGQAKSNAIRQRWVCFAIWANRQTDKKTDR